MKAPASTTWPILVPKDRGPVKIYRINPRGVEPYSGDYYFAGRRQRRAYADFAEATKAAKEVADKLKSGNGNALTLTANDKLIYSRALSSIAGLHTPPDIVAQEWAKVRKSHPNVLAFCRNPSCN